MEKGTIDARIGLLPTSSRAVVGTEADLILVLPGERLSDGGGNIGVRLVKTR